MPSSLRSFPPRSPRPAALTRRPAPGGFTLLEVMIVIAIMALLATVLVGGSVRLLNNRPVSADEIFWVAVQQARKLALKSEHEIQLKFVDDREHGKKFVLSDGDQVAKDFPLPAQAGGDLAVDFLSAQKGGNAILVGGVALETQPLPAVIFYPDGTCTAFRVQIARTGAAHTLAIDPWTCAPVLKPADPYALR